MAAPVIRWHKVAIEDMPKTTHTHVEVSGRVDYVKPQPDGDLHIRLCDRLNCIVAECIPQIPCKRPHIGSNITVRGISRYDKESNHDWYEIHPVLEVK